MEILLKTLGVAVLQLALHREEGAPIPDDVPRAASGNAPKLTIREQVLAALDDKPRRPLEIMQRTGVGKRQAQRALGEKVRTVRVAADDDRAAFYQRVA